MTGEGMLRSIMASVAGFTMSMPSISNQALSAGMLDQVMNGFEKEPLENDDLVRIGTKALKNESKS